jgi:hypothetical protein
MRSHLNPANSLKTLQDSTGGGNCGSGGQRSSVIVKTMNRFATADTGALVCGRFTEREFVSAFEDCTLPGELLHHAEHVHLVWLYLLDAGIEQATAKILLGIRRFAEFHNVPQKFHYTLTVAWVRLIAAAMWRSPAESFNAFLAANSELLDTRLPYRYYSPAALDSTTARATLVEPDISPLP